MDASGCLVGGSQAVSELRQDLALAAHSSVRVLISGEPGVGKKTLAQCLHHQSARSGKPMVVINCARVSEVAQLDRDLFGFSSDPSMRLRPGALEVADGGTLVLDAVSELKPPAQQALLRMLNADHMTRQTRDGLRRTDVRLIACTGPDISGRVAAGEFLEDLYYRLNTVRLHVPSIRDRREDVPELVHHFLRVASQDASPDHGASPVLSGDAMSRLVAYSWPDNMRELAAVASSLARRHRGNSSIDVGALPMAISGVTPTPRERVVSSQTPTLSLRGAAIARSGAPTTPIKPPTTPEALLEFVEEKSGPSRAITPAVQTALPPDPGIALAPPLSRVGSAAIEWRLPEWGEAALRRTRTAVVSMMARAQAMSSANRTIGTSSPVVEQGVTAEQDARAEQGVKAAVAAVPPRSSYPRLLLPFACGAVLGGIVVFVLAERPLMSGPPAARSNESSAPVARSVERTTSTAPAYQLTDARANVPPVAVGPVEEIPPRVTATAGTSTPVAVSRSAERAPAVSRANLSFRGSLSVTSRPSGAAVVVNGRMLGTTPLLLRNLPVGSRALRLELDRYQPWTSTVQVVTNQRASVTADLRPAAQ